jgi:hypothetical protein
MTFRDTLHARIDLKCAIAKQEIRVSAIRHIAELERKAEFINRSTGQSRRFWNERNNRSQ